MRSSALPIVQNPASLPPSTLTYALALERGVFNPSLLQLVLRDGRKFDVDVQRDLVRVQDADGNALQLANNACTTPGARACPSPAICRAASRASPTLRATP